MNTIEMERRLSVVIRGVGGRTPVERYWAIEFARQVEVQGPR